jgi:hypothetical protein
MKYKRLQVTFTDIQWSIIFKMQGVVITFHNIERVLFLTSVRYIRKDS